MMKKLLCMLPAMLMLFTLCACGQGSGGAAPTESAAPTEEPDVAYSVSVADTDGNPIPGVTLQFCDDVTCTMGETDENGAAVFNAKEGTYTVHVLKVPEGVVGTEEEFSFPEAGTEISIALEIPKPAIDRPIIGFTYFNPDKYKDLKGKLGWDVSRISEDVYVLNPTYHLSDSSMYTSLFDVLCVQKEESEAEAYLKDTISPSAGWDAYSLEKVGSAENLTCFLAQQNLSEEDMEFYKGIFGEQFDEFAELRADKETFITGIELHEPAPEILLFETQDLDGNPVSLADVLAGRKVTMVNLWATWCDPCKEELPELQDLSESFEAKDCQVIGVCMDCRAGEDPAEVKAILEEAGVTYLNLRIPEETVELLEINTYPTSYLVDSEGRVLTMPVLGSYVGYTDYVYSGKLSEALSKLEG